jgi:hypothetical protein
MRIAEARTANSPVSARACGSSTRRSAGRRRCSSPTRDIDGATTDRQNTSRIAVTRMSRRRRRRGDEVALDLAHKPARSAGRRSFRPGTALENTETPAPATRRRGEQQLIRVALLQLRGDEADCGSARRRAPRVTPLICTPSARNAAAMTDAMTTAPSTASLTPSDVRRRRPRTRQQRQRHDYHRSALKQRDVEVDRRRLSRDHVDPLPIA